MKPTMKTVKIQDLEPSKDYQDRIRKQDTEKNWRRTKCHHYSKTDICKCATLCYLENVEANVYSHPNSFYGAFVNAYNNHEDIILSPDDVWLTICFQFSKYINNNAEKMRDLFVSQSDKKKLTVTTGKELDESQWTEFFNLMIGAIKGNTKDGIVDTLKCDFSTTKQIESIISVATIMDSFKQYFDYGRCIPMCGIKAVRFMGSLEDWTRLLDKTSALEKYDVDGQWKTYIQNLIPILKNFIDSYNEKVDVDFWNKVMSLTSGRLGSGSCTYVSGWILSFFNLSGKVEDDDIKSYSFDFPVEIDNKMTGETKTVNMIGGFGGVNKTDGAYRPQLSMIVFHDGNVTKIDLFIAYYFIYKIIRSNQKWKKYFL
ncbi:MAG: DUF4419 domain-containing protein [Barrevirus sp.]|uniref:DUF4419 domain-containing protein n=1 Tax=Barrevirus sp. TaxID=2487763 RepID=A0A3G4ZUI4_9VIRU|nr:MAG: DUF4419 domain-containing protein [Barrevirus sp.]